jgi:hypothetical protein
MADSKITSKCARFATCEKIQKRLLSRNWEGMEETLLYAIKTTCGRCPKYAAKPGENLTS